MNLNKFYLLFFMLLTMSSLAPAALVSKIVGKVGEYYLTSRETIASRILEQELYPENKIKLSLDLSSSEFTSQVTAVLLEKVVSMEAESFSVALIANEELKETLHKLKKALSSRSEWQKLAPSDSELEDFISRKLRSKKFLNYKTGEAGVTVSDFEVKDYYEKNRYKFGTLPFDKFKDSIRQFLVQKRSEDRLRDWFDVLRKKYQVRNFLLEKQ